MEPTAEQTAQAAFDPAAPAQVEFLGAEGDGRNASIHGTGYLSRALVSSGGNAYRFASSLRTLDLLREDEWKRMDSTVIQVARDTLVITQRLIGRGLVYNLPNALGIMQLEQERMGDMGPASIQMTALVPDETDRVDFDMTALPIPIISKGFNLNIRHLMASRNGSTPLDVTQAAIASRKVSEKAEDLIINGELGLNFGARALGIPGMMNAPDALGKGPTAASNTIVDNDLTQARARFVNYKSWTDYTNNASDAHASKFALTSTGRQDFFNEVVHQVALLNQMNYFGPFTFYVPRNLWYWLLQDWSDNKGTNSILERLRQIPDISEIITVPTLPVNKTVLMQESIDVVDIVSGLQPTTMTWSPDPGFITHFMVMAILVPRFKSTKARQTGIIIGTRNPTALT